LMGPKMLSELPSKTDRLMLAINIFVIAFR